MEEKVCYLTIRVEYRTDGTQDDPSLVLALNSEYSVEMNAGYGIEVSKTRIVGVKEIIQEDTV